MTGAEIEQFCDTIVKYHNCNGIKITGCFPLTDALIQEGYRKESYTAAEILAEVERELTEHGISVADIGLSAIREKYITKGGTPSETHRCG